MSETKKAAKPKSSKASSGGGGGGGGGSSEDASDEAAALLAALGENPAPKPVSKPKSKKRAPAKAKAAAAAADHDDGDGDEIDKFVAAHSGEDGAEAKAAAASVAIARTAAAAKEQKLKQIDPVDVMKNVATVSMLRSVFGELDVWPNAVAVDVAVRVFGREYPVLFCRHRSAPCLTLASVIRIFAKPSTSRLHYLPLVSSFDGAGGALDLPAELDNIEYENVAAAGRDNARLTELNSRIDASFGAPSVVEFMKRALVPLSALALFVDYTDADKYANSQRLFEFPEEFHLPVDYDDKDKLAKLSLRRAECNNLRHQLGWIAEGFSFARYAQLAEAVRAAKLEDEPSASMDCLTKVMHGRYAELCSLEAFEYVVKHFRRRESGAAQNKQKKQKAEQQKRDAEREAEEKARTAKNIKEADAAADADIAKGAEDAFEEDAAAVIAGKPLPDLIGDKLAAVVKARAQNAKKRKQAADNSHADAKADAEPATKAKKPRHAADTPVDLTSEDTDADGDVEMSDANAAAAAAPATVPAPAPAPVADSRVADVPMGELVGANADVEAV